MSIKLMSMVWDRYQAIGGELLLALALADYAHDNGTSVYAGVETLAKKTRQSVRTVQYQLRRMQETGWLLKVGKGDGGRSRHVTYHINPKWIKGAELAPFTPGEDAADGVDAVLAAAPAAEIDSPSEGSSGRLDGDPGEGVERPPEMGATGANGAITVAPFPEKERVQPEVQKGAIAVAPVIKTGLTVLIPLTPFQGESDGDGDPPEVPGGRGGPQRPRSPGKRCGAKERIGLKAYIDGCRDAGTKPVPPGCVVFEYAGRVGIPNEILALHWAEFRQRHLQNEKRQKDWVLTLLNSVKGNWYGLWAMQAGGVCALTTKGLQAQAWHQEGQANDRS